MITSQGIKRRLPGYIGAGLMILVTVAWTFWSVGEMYYEGWGVAWYGTVAYLIPGAVSLVLTLLALTWPRVVGWLVIAVGIGFTAWWWGPAALKGELTLSRIIGQFPVSGTLVIIGVLFVLEGRYRRQRRADGWTPPEGWLRRNLLYILAVGLPLMVLIGFSAYWLPILLTRVDDGDRGSRLIEGNGVALVWAPEGPGWNWKQHWGGYPSWNRIALFGVPPMGMEEKRGREDEDATAADMESTCLCAYLSDDGLTLMDEPQGVWRMPTADEIVRSLGQHGQNAGCVWEGECGVEAQCGVTPDKETPLWAPDQEPIYYWAADEYDDRKACYVSYKGWVRAQRKSWGNPRHGYRCVREP
jgi:hypothetical protein